MFIKYVREKTTTDNKGIPIGIVIALDKNHIGWSLLNKKDKWNKTIGKQIAIGRAEKGISIPNIEIENGRIDKVIKTIDIVQNIVKDYFK